MYMQFQVLAIPSEKEVLWYLVYNHSYTQYASHHDDQ